MGVGPTLLKFEKIFRVNIYRVGRVTGNKHNFF
jgi:hypothetical protein